jgi:hypothetical protein
LVLTSLYSCPYFGYIKIVPKYNNKASKNTFRTVFFKREMEVGVGGSHL